MYLMAADGRANVPSTWGKVRMKDKRAKMPISTSESVWARMTK